MLLADGRRVAPVGSPPRPGVLPISPGFRALVLANRPGFPFLGNDFFRECGDVLSCHVVEAPSRSSELALLAAYGPDVPPPLLQKAARLPTALASPEPLLTPLARNRSPTSSRSSAASPTRARSATRTPRVRRWRSSSTSRPSRTTASSAPPRTSSPSTRTSPPSPRSLPRSSAGTASPRGSGPAPSSRSGSRRAAPTPQLAPRFEPSFEPRVGPARGGEASPARGAARVVEAGCAGGGLRDGIRHR